MAKGYTTRRLEVFSLHVSNGQTEIDYEQCSASAEMRLSLICGLTLLSDPLNSPPSVGG